MRNLQFIQITPEELQDNILKGIKAQLDDLKAEYQPKLPTENLTRKETCAIHKINLSTLWVWTNKGKLVSYGCGNRVYYKRSEVENALIELKPNNFKIGKINKKN